MIASGRRNCRSDRRCGRRPQWSNVGFRLQRLRQTDIGHLSEAADSHRIQLATADRSYTCRCLPDREGILHRRAGQLTRFKQILTLKGTGCRFVRDSDQTAGPVCPG